MAIDTSAFDKYKKGTSATSTGVTGIDVSAFGYSWEKPTAVSTPTTPAKETIKFIPNTTLSAPPKQSFKPSVSTFVQLMRDYLPKGLSEPLVGTGISYGGGKEDTGLIQFLLPGLTKSAMQKLDDRIAKLTQPREINGVPFQGFSQERAAQVAWNDITGTPTKDLTPLEQKLLNSAGRWETVETGLDLFNFVPLVGAGLKKGFSTQLGRIAKLTDEILIGKEIDALLPKLDEAVKATLIPKLVKANTVDDVAKLIGEATQNAARVGASAAPVLRQIATGKALSIEEAAAESAAQIAERTAATEAPSFVKRAAITVGEAKTKITSVLKNIVEDPVKLESLAQTFRLPTIDEKIRFLAKDGVLSPEDISKQLNDAIDAEKRVFFADKGIKLPENATGDIATKADEQFGKFFEQKFGVPIDSVNNVSYVNRVLNARESAGKAALRATEAVNQTPIQTNNGKQIITNTDVPPAAKVGDPNVDVGSIQDLARRDQATLNPVRAIGTKIARGRDLAKEIEANIAKYNAKIPEPEIVAIREKNLLGKETIEEIISRKRGIITDAQSIERARAIKGTLQDVIDLPKGTAATKEQLQAIEQIVQNERNINKGLKVLIDNGGMAATQAERNLLKRMGEGFETMTDHEVLNHALAESTYNLKRAEVVLLGVRAETGRALQSMNKVVEGVDNRLRILFNKINGNKKYSALEKQSMIELVAKMDVNDNQAFMAALEKIAKSDFFDKVAEWSVAAKLWNPTTHVVNFAGNTLRQTADISIKTVTNPFAAKADFMGAAVGFKRGLGNALKALTDEGYAAQLSKYVETGGTAPAIGGKLGKWVRTPFRMLGASDEIFKNVAYQRKLYRDAHAIAAKEGLSGKQLSARMEELLNTPTFKMMEDATNEAKRMTFQEDMGEFMTKIDALRNPAAYEGVGAKSLATFARFFVPFLKTPTNLFKQAIDFSPVGLVKNFGALKTAIKGGDKEKVATILGEAIVGSAIGTFIAMETLDGNVTGGAPSNAGEKDRFYRENKIPYAIKIGDNWFEYKRLDPFASIIGLTADMVTLEEKNVGSLFGVIAENLKDKTYLSGVSDLMKVITGEDWERDYALKSMVLGGILPSFVGHTTRSVDPTIRVADTLGQRLLVQIPGMSESFPAKVNVLGYDVKRANKGLNYFFNPIQSDTAKIDPITQELLKIDKTIAVPATSFTKDKIKYTFTDAEYEDFARFTGIKLRNDLADMFKSPKYERANDEEKIKMIDKLREEIQTQYKEEYVKEKTGGGKVTDIQRAKNILQGKDPNAPALNDSASIRSYFMNE